MKKCRACGSKMIKKIGGLWTCINCCYCHDAGTND